MFCTLERGGALEPSSYVQPALRQIRMDLSIGISRLETVCSQKLDVLDVGLRDELLQNKLQDIWREMIEQFSTLVARHFEALVDIAVANPELISDDPLRWAEDFVRPYRDSFFEWATAREEAREGFLSRFHTLLDENEQDGYKELETDLWVELDLSIGDSMAPALIKLARQGWKPLEPAEKPARGTEAEASLARTLEVSVADLVARQGSKPLEAAEQIPKGNKPETPLSSALKFTLADIEQAPQGVSLNEVVRYLYRPLSDAIRAVRSWQEDERVEDREITELGVAQRFAILRALKTGEFEILLNREYSPQKASLEIMQKRAPHLSDSTIVRYLRRMGSKKTK